MQVRGFLEMGNTRYERPVIFGHWDDALSAQMPDGSEVRESLPNAIQPASLPVLPFECIFSDPAPRTLHPTRSLQISLVCAHSAAN